MSLAIQKVVEHLKKEGLEDHHSIVPNVSGIDQDMQSAGFLNATPLVVEWAQKREQIHTSWSELRDWMTKFNVHLKRSTISPTSYPWTNGILGVTERLRIRLPNACVVYGSDRVVGNIFQVTLSASKSDHDFAQWYLQRILYQDPATQRQVLTSAQIPTDILTQQLDESVYFLRMKCTDSAITTKLRPGVEVRGAVIEIAGVSASTSKGTHLIHLSQVESVWERVNGGRRAL